MIGFPFDSVVSFDEHGYPIFDRAVSSKPLKALIGKLFTTGVMPNPSNNLQVFAGEEGMTVTVKAGFCVIEGGLKLEDTDRTLEVQASDTTYDRIDTVVMRWNGNDNARICDLYVVEGTPASSPVRPELNREGSIYEIGLADIFIPKNTGAIAQQRITDTRMDTNRCGIVSSISEFDTSTLYAQVQADLTEFKDVEEADFIEWYEAIKDRIDAITAEMLQDQIDALDSGKADKVSGATNNNFAGLDSNGNLKDSGKKASDFQTTLNLSSATATGNPLSFTTDSKQVANNTVITLEPIQAGSGDPSPSNVRAISGYKELDIVSQSPDNLILYTIPNVSIDSSGVINASNDWTVYVVPVSKGSTYTLRANQLVVGFYTERPKIGSVSYNNSRIDEGSLRPLVAPISGYMAFRVVSSWGYAPMAVLGDTAITDYHSPNIATDITIKLDETIYGGTLDVESGELTVNSRKYNAWDLAWTKNDSSSSDYLYRTSSLGSEADLSSNALLICSHAQKLDYTPDGTNIGMRSTTAYGGMLYMNLGTAIGTNTASGFKTYCENNNVQLVCALKNPFVIHLTPHQVKLLQGANVVTSNGTSISLTYRNGNVMTLADTEGLADSIEALNRTWVYDDYVVQGNGTTTWRDLLQLLQPIYNGLTEQEKTYSKIIIRADDSFSNECLTYVGAYWYARDAFNNMGLWGSRVSLEGDCSRSSYYNGTFTDDSLTQTSSALALRVLRAQENATQIVTSSRSVSNENTRSLPGENVTKSDTLKTDELNEINKIDAEDVKNDN